MNIQKFIVEKQENTILRIKLAQKLQKAGKNILFCFGKFWIEQFNSPTSGPTLQVVSLKAIDNIKVNRKFHVWDKRKKIKFSCRNT